jgi:hypothetical protein
VKERPIIFSGPMVKALLAGAKTQTRRVVKPQPYWQKGKGLVSPGWAWNIEPKCKLQAWPEDGIGSQMAKFCPYGIVGDRLWVREAWSHGTAPNNPNGIAVYLVSGSREQFEKEYAKLHPDAPKESADWCHEWVNKSPLFMPRWASRITLELTGVRVERLQSISMEDAKAEGVLFDPLESTYSDDNPPRKRIGGLQRLVEYKKLWDKINGKKHPWESNPFVWVLEFRRIES